MKVTKIFTFDAAHFLPKYEGKCKNLHGHRWTLEVTIKGFVNRDTGMVMDFSQIKKNVEPLINRLDHHLINDTLENPTAEELVKFFWRELRPAFGTKLYRIKVWESPDSYAEREGEEE
jgi:6-pyruvoyltetrahydropterin/6-carboxytetrahydropterin synthase